MRDPAVLSVTHIMPVLALLSVGIGLQRCVIQNQNEMHKFSKVTGVLQQTFSFQLMNDLRRSFTKIMNILFLSKAVFIKRTLLFQYFVLKIEQP